MKWYVRKLPDSITNVSIGNPQLVAFVNQVLTLTSTSLRTPASRDLAAARLAFAAGRAEVALAQARALTVSLLDARGRLVQSLHSGELSAGSHSFALPGASQGVHWVVLRDKNRNV